MPGLFRAAATCSTGDAVALDDYELGREYVLAPMVKMYIRAIEEQTLTRALDGRVLPGVKLVKKRADRVWKDGALVPFSEKFGALAMTAPAMKSPAQMEKIGDAAKTLVAEWAFVPDNGFTVALDTDRRQAEKTSTAAEVFSHFTKGGHERPDQ
jgi:hypothetical protein